MRCTLTIVVSCLILLLCAPQPAASQTDASMAADTAGTGNQSDAAEKHAKRTACLKDAKTKKLVGAQKTAYLKDCMAADGPKPLSSASAGSPS